MKDWQVKWIDKNWLELYKKTKCDIKLLDELRDRKQITEEEVNDLERMEIHDKQGGYKKVRELYSLLKTRAAYDHLVQVLEQNCQTDAAQILNDGWDALDSKSLKNNIRLQKYVSLPKELEDFLKRNNLNSGKIFVLSTLDCDVTCERINNAGGIPVVKLEGTRFSSELTEHTTIAISPVENVEQMVSHQISDGIRNSSRIIIITKKSKEDILKEVPKSFPITVTEDNLTLQDLSENYKEDLLNRNVLIQNRTWSLKEWIFATGLSLNDNDVGGQLLIDLINEKTPILLKNALPQKLFYYVSRRLCSRTILSRDKIFQDRSKDVFLFTGLQRHQLSTLVSEGHEALLKKNTNLARTPPATDSSKIQIKKKILSVRFILLDHFSDFEDICDRTSEPVHWLRREENDTYRLVKSKGSNKVIQGMVEDKNKQYECSENEFWNLISNKDLGDLSEQHECISDSPGMGKTILLAEVGRQSLEKNTTTVGIFQELPKFIKSATKNFLNKESRCADSIQHLFSSITTGDFSKRCLESGLKNKSLKLNLFLDAYDELDSKDFPLCKELLQVFKIAGNIRVFITSRPHLLPELENIFEVIGWNILPFTQQDQYNFLFSVWRNRPEGQIYKTMEIDLLQLEKYTKNFVSALQNQWNDKDRAIAGIPLQCHLISVIYHPDAFKSCSQGSSPNSSEPSPEIGSLTNLYTSMVEKKLEIFKEKYPTTSLDARKVNKWYAAQAFCDLFPDVDYEALLGEDDADPKVMIKIGIVEQKGNEGKMQFIHRTFAEYFIAKALFELLTNPQDTNFSQEYSISLVDFLKILLTLFKDLFQLLAFNFNNEVFFKFYWFEIVYHLNALLEDANTVCAISPNLNLSEQYLTDLTKSIVYEDLPNILQLLHNWNCFKGIENEIFTQKLIKTAVGRSCLKLIQIVVQYKTEKEICEMVDKRRGLKLTLLHYAVARGDYNIFEFLLETYFKNRVKNCQYSDDVLRSLVYVCVKCSLIDRDVVISGKKEIIKRLFELNNRLLEFSCLFKPRNISSLIHPVLFVVIHRIGIFVRESDKKKLLNKAMSYMSWKDYSHLVQKLSENGHLQNPISKSETVEFASSKYTLSRDTFNILKHAQVDFNRLSKLVFKHALSLTNDESAEYLKFFFNVWVEPGKEFNPNGQSYLHVALKSLNPTVVSWLIDTKGLNVNCVDTLNGDTPLQYICQIEFNFIKTEQVAKIVEMITLLINKGANAQILNAKGESLLHLAAENSAEEIVKVLIDKVEDINGKDCNGNTALLRAVKNTDPTSIINVLLKDGLDPKVSNNREENLLHLLSWDELWVERLVDVERLSVNSTDKKGNTPLHFAAVKSDCIQGISKLVEKGGDINAVNEGGFTPFHVYLYHADLHSLEVVEYFIARVPNEDQLTTALKTLIYSDFEISLLNYESISEFYFKLSPRKYHLVKETTAGIVNELVNNGADIQVLISNISHILSYLEKFNSKTQYEFLKLLVDHNVCSMKEIAYQGLRLMVKCSQISEEYMKLGESFADHLDDINKRNSKGRTLLHVASLAGSHVGVKWLVEKGAKVNELDGNGSTPLDFIYLYCSMVIKSFPNNRKNTLLRHLKSNEIEIAKFLESHGAKDNRSNEDKQLLNTAMKGYVESSSSDESYSSDESSSSDESFSYDEKF